MIFRGWQKNSLIEWPDKIASIVFVGGCNFACPWCSNKDLVQHPEKFDAIKSEEILEYLQENKKFLDGVMITGGEPLKGQNYEKDELVEFIKEVKKIGLGVGVETNGTNPDFLEYLLKNKLVDYVAMDVKAPLSSKFSKNFDTKSSVRQSSESDVGQPLLSKYSELAGVSVDVEKIKKSIDLIRKLAPDYEFRTTVVPGMLTKEDLFEIADYLKGAKRFILQEFDPKLAPGWPKPPFLTSIADEVKQRLAGYFEIFDLRL